VCVVSTILSNEVDVTPAKRRGPSRSPVPEKAHTLRRSVEKRSYLKGRQTRPLRQQQGRAFPKKWQPPADIYVIAGSGTGDARPPLGATGMPAFGSTDGVGCLCCHASPAS
jgi:hypothetical protein